MGDSKAIYVSMGEGFLNELFFFHEYSGISVMRPLPESTSQNLRPSSFGMIS